MDTMSYERGEGTAGIQGQLYETKLISLILFRLLRDKRVEQFYLASNYAGIGPFDDICFKVKITERERPILVFIQVKHKEDDHAYLEYDLIKHFFDSLTKVKEKIFANEPQKRNDPFFNDNFRDIECKFILYTNATYVKKYTNKNISHVKLDQEAPPLAQNNFEDIIKDIINTGNEISQNALIDYTENILEHEINTLAERLVQFLTHKTNESLNIINDTYIARYHVYLTQHVVDISEAKYDKDASQKWRTLTFRPDFFNTNNNDKVLNLLKRRILELIFNHELEYNNATPTSDLERERITKLISNFLTDPSAITLSPLIGTHIIDKKNNFEIKMEVSKCQSDKLKEVNISPSIISAAKIIKATDVLLSIELKVPITFGNIDLTIRGDHKKICRRLKHLSNIIADLCSKSTLVGSHRIVIIDKSVGDSFLNSNGGIGSAIGNLFVYDNDTKYLKFARDITLLKSNARALFDMLTSSFDDLHVYRFDVKDIITFPKFNFDYTDEVKLVDIYVKQSNHSRVQEILEREIKEHWSHDRVPVKVNTIFLHYHNNIQEWWMAMKRSPYFTKTITNALYQSTLRNIVIEPHMSAMHNTFYMNNIKYFKYDYTEHAKGRLKSLEDYSRILVVTDIYMLTIIKVIQCLRNNHRNKYSIVDLEYMKNLEFEDFSILISEINNTEKVLIVVCNIMKNCGSFYRRLDQVARATDGKNIIVITNSDFAETAQEYFNGVDIVFTDRKQNLTDLTPKSRQDVIENTEVIFQGVKVNLDLILDDESVTFVKGSVLKKILRNETINIGKSLVDAKYDDIKHLYIDRKIRSTFGDYETEMHSEPDVMMFVDLDFVSVNTFYDITQNVVLLTATPGMGKSTLLTHLSMKTKESDGKIWVVRINLLDHTDEFQKWTESNTVDSSLERLTFIYQVTSKHEKMRIVLKEINNNICLGDCTGDEEATFELNLFLHLYNENKLVFLFDGFDEICPYYKEDAITFFKYLKNNIRQNRMWVTSRPYKDILTDLEAVLGKSYIIEYINETEQEVYLKKFWQDRIIIENFSDEKLNQIVTELYSRRDSTIGLIQKHFCDYLRPHQSNTAHDTDIEDEVSIINSITDVPRNVRLPFRLLGTPLLLYLLADYFANLVIDFDPNKLPVNINFINIYENFIDTKIKIFFEDKYGTKVSMPYNKLKFERERKDCINMYKKIGAYAIFKDILFDREFHFDQLKDTPFNEEGKTECITLIKGIESNTDPTGLISYVTPDDVPVFVHMTFAEYFATEFLCDILKSNKYDSDIKQLLYITLVLLDDHEVINWISAKRCLDKELDRVIRDIKKMKPTGLSETCKFIYFMEYATAHFVGVLKKKARSSSEGRVTTLGDNFPTKSNMDNLLKDIPSRRWSS